MAVDTSVIAHAPDRRTRVPALRRDGRAPIPRIPITPIQRLAPVVAEHQPLALALHLPPLPRNQPPAKIALGQTRVMPGAHDLHPAPERVGRKYSIGIGLK